MAEAMVQAACPGCRQVLQIPGAWIGQTLKCKHCGLMFKAQAGRAGSPAPATFASKPKTEDCAPETYQLADKKARAAVAAGGAFAGLDDAPASKVKVRQRHPWRSAWWTGLALFAGTFCLSAPLAGAMWSVIRPRHDVQAYLAGELDENDLFAKHSSSPGGNPDSGSRSSSGGVSSSSVIRPVSSSSPASTVSPVSSRPPMSSSPSVIAPSSSPIKPPPPPDQRGFANRRALVVGIHNYLIFNTTLAGPVNSVPSRYQVLADRLGSGLMIPRSNITLLSDAIAGQPARPVRSVLLDVFTDFTATARAQDCLFLYFTGHIVEAGDPAELFLVPLDGEPEAVETLIPFKWLLGKLEESPARQKVLVLDVCRYNAERGLQRRASNAADPKTEGAMWEELDKKLKEPPAGVQIWTACAPDQFSQEIEEGMHNGVFVEGLIDVLGKNAGQKAQQPEDAIAVEALVEPVNGWIKRELDKRKQIQVSRVSGQARQGGTSYDPKEPAPPALVIKPQPAAGGVMKVTDLRALLAEIEVPAVNTRMPEQALKIETLPPFDVIRMDAYREDKERDKDVREFVLAKQKQLVEHITKQPVQEEFRAPGDEGQFKGQLSEMQKPIAKAIRELEDAVKEMQGATEMHDKASKHWQANFDYVLSRMQQRVAYLYEYTSQLGQMKSGVPERDASIQDGWCLISVAKLQGDKTGKDMKKAADKLLGKMAEDYKGTPWEILAKRDHADSLGLDIVATKVRNR